MTNSLRSCHRLLPWLGGAVVAALILSACQSRPKTVTVFYTNDIHATFRPSKERFEDPAPVGGFVALDCELRRMRGSTRASLLVDGGDLLSGNEAGALRWRGVAGGHFLRFMSLLGYDAMAVGNHDLDHGVENLLEAARIASFPLLAANVVGLDGKPLLGPGWIVLRRGGVRIGLIGVVTESLDRLVPPPVAARFTVRPPATVADSLARMLDPRTDLLILLSHCGLDADRFLARRLGNRLDVIVGSHSHHRLERPLRAGRVLIVQAGSMLRCVGRLDLVVKDDRVVRYDASLVTLRDTAGCDPAPGPVEALAESLDAVLDAAYGDTVGMLEAPLTRSYYAESSMGNWVADALRWYSKADVAVINSGTLRADLEPGPLTVRRIRSVLPFENRVVTFECEGRELEQLLLHNAKAARARTHGILQVSGCSCRVHGPEGEESVEVTVTGQRVRPEAIYTCATVDFVASGAPEKYLGFVPRGIRDYSVLLSYAVEQAVRAGVARPTGVEGRMVFDGSTERGEAR